MKLIAIRDFARVQDLETHIEEKDLKHPNHIHKGHKFSIGKSDRFEDLTRAEQAIVAQLNSAGCIGDATNPKTVKAIEEEVAMDKRREEEAAKRNEHAELGSLSAGLRGLVAKAAAK